MKKILVVLVMLLLVVGCSKADEMALGSYKGRTYTNDAFNFKFDITEDFSFLTEEELKTLNDASHEQSKDPEKAKYVNKVMELSNTDKVSLIMYVDATPEVYKNADAEANAYLDFLTNQRVSYSLEKEDRVINDLDYKVLKLAFDFEQNQYSMYAVNEDKIITIQITYPKGQEAVVEDLLKMIDSNE